MKSLVWKVICIPAALFTIGHIEASAEIIIPPGLKPGDTYHLAFVTTGTTSALSPYVDTYNSFVTQQASLPGAVTQGYGVNWYAIASTPTVDARDNVPISGPVYLLNGLLVANNRADLWDGTLQSSIVVNQFGDLYAADVFTGSAPNGTGNHPYSLGEVNNVLEPQNSYVTWGTSVRANSGWSTYSIFCFQKYRMHMYAVSAPLTVPAVPEPSSAIIWTGVLGVVLLVT